MRPFTAKRRKRGGSSTGALGAATATVAALLTVPTTSTQAVTKNYVGPASGPGAVWNLSGNWSPAGVPDSVDVANILNADSTSRNISIDVLALVAQLNLGNTGLGTNTLTQSTGFGVAAAVANVGSGTGGKGAIVQSTAGNEFEQLVLGNGTSSNGTYDLSGSGTLKIYTEGAFTIGLTGTGTFNQTGGSVQVGENPDSGQFDPTFTLASASGSVGNYNLSGAGSTLSVRGPSTIGAAGTAVFTHSAGSFTTGVTGLGDAPADPLNIGSAAGGSGTYNLSNTGAFTAHGGLNVGGTASAAGGAGVVGITGGTANITGTLKIWNTTGTGVSFSNGTLTVGAIDTSGNASRFTWTGGTLNVTGAGGLSVGPTGPIGSTVTTTASKPLNVTNALTVASGGTLNVNSGTQTAGSVTVASGGAANVNAGTLETGIVALSGTLTGAGTVNALVNLNSGGTISPGNSGGAAPGTLTLGGVTFNAGGKLTVDVGDQLNVTAPNALSLSGSTGVTLVGAHQNTSTLVTYAGTLGGTASNLRFTGGAAGYDYAARNNAAAHAVELVPKKIAAHTLVAKNGQAAPGTGGGTFSNVPFTSPPLGAAGQVAVIATLAGTTDGSTTGVFLKSAAGPVVPVARQGQAAPGGGTFGAPFQSVGINDLGQVAFAATAGTAGIFRGDASTLVAIAREGQAAPGFGGGTLTSQIQQPVIGNSGQVAFNGQVLHSSGFNSEGKFIGDGTTLAAIVRNGQAAPGGGTFAINMGTSLAINDVGQVAFSDSLGGTAAIWGVFRGTATTDPILIARTLQSAPGAGGGTFANTQMGSPVLNNSGQVAFFAELSGTSDGSQRGLFRGAGGAPTNIARNSTPAPGAGGGTIAGFGEYQINDAGQVSFISNVNGATGGSDQGIFRGDGTTVVSIARMGDPAPGPGGGTFTFGNPGGQAFGAHALLNGGQVAYHALAIANTVGGTTDNTGIFLTDGQETIAAVRAGQLLDGNTVSSLAFARQPAANDFGQVAYTAVFPGGSRGAYVFTPTLHWRTAGSDNWDTSANWTVGLAPAHVHDVFIDPALPLTVTGPAAGDTVKSLTIGGGGAPATLHLAGTDVVLRTSSLAIDAAGGNKLDMGTSDLILDYAPGDPSPVAAIEALIAQGFNGGGWDGPGGILSSDAAADPNFVLAVAENALLLVPFGDGGAGDDPLFSGQAVDDTTVLVKYTHRVDLDLDGLITGNDAAVFNAFFNEGQPATWQFGDLDYDGIYTGNDAAIFNGFYNESLPHMPEPSTTAVLALAALAATTLNRRRHRRRPRPTAPGV